MDDKMRILVLVAIMRGALAAYSRSYHQWSRKEQVFIEKTFELPFNASSLQEGFFSRESTEPWQGKAQAKQDVIVRDIFQNLKNGYFVDIGANDWLDLSNTYRLEHYLNWTGICIEPNPGYHLGLLANRKCQLFTNPLGANNNETIAFRFLETFSGFVGSGISDNNHMDHYNHKKGDLSIENHLETVTLQRILEFVQAPPIIHYLSLDIEGAEYFAFKHFPFHQYTFYVVTVERPKAKLHALLAKQGYVFVKILADFGDCLYLHSSFPRFGEVWQHYYDSKSRPQWLIYEQEVLKTKHPTYLLQPEWRGDPTVYVHEAKKLLSR